jgi:lysophospholipase L1-like esterase
LSGPRQLPALVRRALIPVIVIVLAVAGAAGAVAALDARINPGARPATAGARTPLVPAVGRTGTSTCTDPVAGQEWRVGWKITAGPTATTGTSVEAQAAATAIVPTGFAVRSIPAPGAGGTGTATASPSTTAAAAGEAPTALPASPIERTTKDGWIDRGADRWALRWSPTLAQTLAAGPYETYARTGPLATLATLPVDVAQSPRLTTPDGACTVFLTPFVSGSAGRPAVAVVGDSLVAQLDATQDDSLTGPGQLPERLSAGGRRVEINGQAGRRWTIMPGTRPGLDQADLSMFDEIRGLRAADSMVVALGTNDAGWAALAPDDATYELRLAWVLLHLAPMIDELAKDGHCTVLTTMAARNKRYLNSMPGRFDDAANRINAYLRERAGADPHDRLKLWDWGTHADPHGTADPEPWFGPDTIHLLATGRNAYADDLTRAAALC